MLFEPCFSHLITLRAGPSLFFTTVDTAVHSIGCASFSKPDPYLLMGVFNLPPLQTVLGKRILYLTMSHKPQFICRVIAGQQHSWDRGFLRLSFGQRVPKETEFHTRHSPNSKARGEGWEQPGEVPPPGGVVRAGPRSRGGAFRAERTSPS